MRDSTTPMTRAERFWRFIISPWATVAMMVLFVLGFVPLFFGESIPFMVWGFLVLVWSILEAVAKRTLEGKQQRVHDIG